MSPLELNNVYGHLGGEVTKRFDLLNVRSHAQISWAHTKLTAMFVVCHRGSLPTCLRNCYPVFGIWMVSSIILVSDFCGIGTHGEGVDYCCKEPDSIVTTQ